MTDETRADLRTGLEALVRWSLLPGAFVAPAEVEHETVRARNYRSWAVGVVEPFDPNADFLPEPPALPPEKQLALSVLAGDPATLPQSLADYMLDIGHEYAEQVAAKSQAKERERVLGLIDAMLKTAPHPTSNHLALLKMHVHDPENADRMFRELMAKAQVLTEHGQPHPAPGG